MNSKVRDSLFFLCILSLLFSATPLILNLKLLGGPFFRQLVIFPLLASIFYTFYWQIKQKNILDMKKEFGIYIGIYMLILFLSLVWGLISYPYYNDILNGPQNQIERLPKVLNLLNSLGLYVERQTLIPIWMFLRPFKNIFLETLYTFGGTYIFFNWYKNDPRHGIRVLEKGIITAVIICLIYSSIEIPQLCGNKTAIKILSAINPYIHSIKISNNWWPPLLWKAQVRSVFAEPSFFGIFAAFSMPIIWLLFFKLRVKKYKYWSLIVITAFTFNVFLTQARTAILLLFGELFLLAVSIIVLKKKEYFKQVISLFLCCAISFFGAVYCVSHYVVSSRHLYQNTELVKNNKVQPKNNQNNNAKSKSTKDTKQQSKNQQTSKQQPQKEKDQNKGLKAYVENNMASAISDKKRSNVSRFAMIKTNIKIGLSHPILGVGYTLRTGYIPDYMTPEGAKTVEIHNFIKSIKKDGIMKATVPILGEFAGRFAETGVIGLIWFMIPPLYLIFLLCKKLKLNKQNLEVQMTSICILISLIGLLVSAAFDIINNSYAFWILLGIGYALCYEEMRSVK